MGRKRHISFVGTFWTILDFHRRRKVTSVFSCRMNQTIQIAFSPTRTFPVFQKSPLRFHFRNTEPWNFKITAAKTDVFLNFWPAVHITCLRANRWIPQSPQWQMIHISLHVRRARVYLHHWGIRTVRMNCKSWLLKPTQFICKGY